ncbi:MAG: hypothetical protein R3D63_07975 [Paracoccaceae bacterium]
MSDLPVWLGKARRIRGAVLVVLLAVIFLAFHARLGMAGESALRPALPLVFLAVTALALWADGVWLRRNHHRVNEWGLNRGKEFRKKPE